MIRYGLVCASGHGFDAWFRSSGDFESQSAKGLLSCPDCGVSAVTKALMAPALATGGSAGAATTEAPPAAEPAESLTLVDDKKAKLRQLLREVRAEITKGSEDVGDRFPEVARKMHAEEIEQRTIHGRATPEEARALVDEGVAVQPLPAFPDDLN
ncbi:DUF1178 family protein [Methylopila sp. M107]|uniref:DUF1178 family protein n=1 Tax=Methylopila sp. M107 TaxID=1101190 RepID=UPI0003735992|nr:DUF1178 family protein [Methylopila sp. M107]